MVEFQISSKITVGADSRVYEGSEAELQAFSRVESTDEITIDRNGEQGHA
jgi:hypothetical protein